MMLEKLRPRLATILLIVNLTVVILPLGSLVFFRIYENQLVRQTEGELISQGAVLAAAYRQEIVTREADLSHYGVAVTPMVGEIINGFKYVPILPRLDLTAASPKPDRPDGKRAETGPDKAAIAAGKVVTAIITEAQRSTLAGLKILDYRGVVVAARFERGLSFAHVAEVKTALSGKYASVIRHRKIKETLPTWSGISRGTGIRVFVAYPIIHADRLLGVAYLSRSPTSILQVLYAQRSKVILAVVTMMVMAALLAFLTSATISRPIRRLVRRMRAIAEGDKEAMQPMRRPGTQEMALLSKGVSDMSLSLDQRSQYIRDFAAHVSHEFKTPLTSIQGASELLVEHFDTMSDAERHKFLNNIKGDADRLEKLVTRLLELARADNLTPHGGHTHVAEALAGLKEKYPLLDYRAEPVCVSIDRDNFNTLFGNLLANSVHHKASKIQIDVDAVDDQVVFTVKDNGEGISSANVGKIFTPFFTTRRNSGGTGLGLGIASSLAAAHGGRIEYLPTQSGTAFVVTLGAASTS